MAGYIFNLDSLHSLEVYASSGLYATKFRTPSGSWQRHHEGTFADYSTMKAGDNVYFFIERKIYGIGRLVTLSGDCKFLNFPSAGKPRRFSYKNLKDQLLWDEGEVSVNQRCICIFEPDPFFFKLGVDMDDALSSNPAAFRMLRAFWKLSFIKFGDEENQAFRDIILKQNQEILSNSGPQDAIFESKLRHPEVARILSRRSYRLESGISSMLLSCSEGDCLRHEMAIEAGLLHQLSIKHPSTCAVLGQWEYLSHQVIASPFKPIDYMDKMDLFGCSYIPGFKPTKARFLVGEVKKDAAKPEDVDQLLKYVDWVRDEYCHGDYSMICAFLIAYGFSEEVIQHKQRVAARRYTVGVRPAKSLEWNNVKCVRYSFDASSQQIVVETVA